jgi:hypothetical protein
MSLMQIDPMKGTHAPFAQHGAPMNPQSTHAPSSHTLLAPQDCPSWAGSGSHPPLLQRWHVGQSGQLTAFLQLFSTRPHVPAHVTASDSGLHRFFFFFFFRFPTASRDEPPKAARRPAPASPPSAARREISLSRRRAS